MKIPKEYLLLALVFAVSVLMRWYFISQNSVFFFFDQSRDAYVSRQIFEQGDIKIQGPSASGTQDTVYHGVLYYYVIGALYKIGQGNPAFVAHALSFFFSLSVVPLYFLSRDIFSSKRAAFLAVLLFCFSFESVLTNTWLSNPALAFPAIIVFFYCVYQVFFLSKTKWIPVLAIALGASHQSLVSTLFLWGVIVTSVFYAQNYSRTQKKGVQIFTVKHVVIFLLLYTAVISTMIVSQLLLMKNGIFTLEKLSAATSQHESSSLESSFEIMKAFIQKAGTSLYPTLPVLSFLCIGVIMLRFKMYSHSTKWFFLQWILSPLFLLIFHSRNSQHILVGLEIPLYLLFGHFLALLLRKKNGFIVCALFLFLFVFSNFSQLQKIRSTKRSDLWIERGALLSDQLKLIDRTYELAEGQPFSISSVTNPYLYNTTWAYLYDWYGKKKYGYVPVWYGNEQAGIFGEELLVRVEAPLSSHFNIKEPDPGVFDWMRKEIDDKIKPLKGEPKQKHDFGTIEMTYFGERE